MTNFDKAMKHVLKEEGGWSDNPNDSGGATNKGITIGSYSEYLNRPATKAELRSISNSQVRAIYKERWDKIRGDEINNLKVSLPLFDQTFNKGSRPVGHLKQILGLPKNGTVTPEMVEKINQLSSDESKKVQIEFLEKEMNDYQEIVKRRPENKVFSNGWKKRINNLAKATGLPALTNQMEGLVLDPNQAEADAIALAQASPVRDIDDGESIDINNRIASGYFRFNDIVFDIPPESISIDMDEYANSIMLMREETPVMAQSGKKRIRMIVNFPIDTSFHGYDKLSRMIIQSKKSPIAIIDNEKIRKELFNNPSDNSNIAVIVENINGYSEEDHPGIIRCTLQLTWFNHAPYVEEVKFIEMIDGKPRKQRAPSSLFKKFYENETTTVGGNLINDPGLLDEKDKMVLMYKEYGSFEKETTIVVQRNTKGSQLNTDAKGISFDAALFINKKKEEGWYLAEEEEEGRLGKPISGIFYRWRRFEIPFADFNPRGTSGALILQNVSFSFNTNPTYIEMDLYSMPTVQFLGGNTSELRAIVFAAAEYAGEQNKTAVGTSNSLATLSSIFKKVSADRITYSKFSKENHLLISHPLAKLLKYRSHNVDKKSYKYIEKNGEPKEFKIDQYLPVIVSSTKSSTIPNLPFASSIQIDFKETRLAKASFPIKYEGDTGSSDAFKIQKKIIEKIYINSGCTFGRQGFVNDTILDRHKWSAESIAGKKLANALNQLLAGDKDLYDLLNGDATFSSTELSPMGRRGMSDDEMAEVNSQPIDAAYKSKFFFSEKIKRVHTENPLTQKESKELKKVTRALYGPLSIKETEEKRAIKKEIENFITDQFSEHFNVTWVNNFVLSLYSDFIKGLEKGEEWVADYVDLFTNYTDVRPKNLKDLYPDMLLPDKIVSPAYYLDNNSYRVNGYRNTIINSMAGVYGSTTKAIKQKLIEPTFLAKTQETLNPYRGSTLSKDLKAGETDYAPAANYAGTDSENLDSSARVHNLMSEDYRFQAVRQAIAETTPPVHSLDQVYPAFQVQLFSEKLSHSQAYSSEDLKSLEAMAKNQRDLLDIYDLSSIVDIRIIKDEYEAADVMIIRVLGTHKSLMTKQSKDPSFHRKDGEDILDVAGRLISDAMSGQTTMHDTYNTNLEDIGLKEGIKIRAFLGNSNDIGALELEFNGRIAAISNGDIIEIYCMGDGHELIQNTIGVGDEKKTYSWNSGTNDLLAKVIAQADEIKSFGNTNYKIKGNFGLDLPLLLGGRNALDNIYAPVMHRPVKGWGTFIEGALLRTGSAVSLFGGILIPLVGVAGLFGPLGLVAAVAAFGIGTLGEVWDAAKQETNPAQFTIFQQTVWDVLQEMTLRHPGYVTAVVPFDNRSTIYFGEPDGVYFCRGAATALEKALKIKASNELGLGERATLREIYDAKAEFSDAENIKTLGDSTTPTSRVDSKERLEKRALQNSTITKTDAQSIAILGMQKNFRAYHIVTSHHDIVSNRIEASSIGVANSVQVHHPGTSGQTEFTGSRWFSSYKITDRMKADDDLHSNLINNKTFTFHNAHEDHPGLHLPEKYAKAVLCKELENIYKGKLTILGRKGIKPHDIVILDDKHNKISGPIGVQRVMHTISPTSGWITSITPKFIAIPDTSTGAYQIKSILKAARYWLGAEADLFYSNMEKFLPSDATRRADIDEDLDRSIEQLENQGFQDLEPDPLMLGDVPKEKVETEGESFLLSNKAIIDSATLGSHLGGSVVGNKVIAPYVLSRGIDKGVVKGIKGIYDIGGEYLGSIPINTKNFELAIQQAKLASNAGKSAFNAIKNTNSIRTGVTAAKTTFKAGLTGGLVLGKLGLGTLGGIAGGFLVEAAIDSAVEGFINFMAYRQPISIFPLTKDGKPWMAALNGFKENTPLEHLELQAARGADKLGATAFLVSTFLDPWLREPVVGGNTEEEVVTRVLDGDTIETEGGRITSPAIITGRNETIRISGIDTGESKADKNTAEYRMGKRATEAVSMLLTPGTKISIVRYESDNYGRKVAEVKFRSVEVNGVDLGRFLVDNYYAIPYSGGLKDNDPKRWEKLEEKFKAAQGKK
jgi:lysozyme family protein/endonuclease YncB( thermonuclease family)